MKKSLAVFALITSICLGTTFVVVSAEIPVWVDPNMVGPDDEVYSCVTMLGHQQRGGCTQTVAGIGVEYTVLTSPSGFTWDVNEPNEFRFEWVPTATGIFYARICASVTEPYEAGDQYWTIALKVNEPLWPTLSWWSELIRYQTTN